ncbi:hypothetical protein HDV00_005262 [Rhizophlyctis rosea]|nr:hypothetical protein HDV00_005262 [Rhizophlyctis rosea]
MANPLLRNTYGDTAYDLAAQSEEAYICELLEEAEKHWIERQSRDRSRDPSRRSRSLQTQVQHNTVVEIIHENQRSGFLSNKYSGANLTRNDTRGPWSAPSGTPMSRDEVVLPTVRAAQSNQMVRGWFWLTDWKVDTKHPRVENAEGWQYARAFDEPDAQWVPAPSGSVLMGGWVRRRRWIRVRKRRLDVEVEGGDGDGAGNELSPEREESDYVVEAKTLVESFPKAAIEAGVDGVKGELRRYEDAIQLLLQGGREDKSAIRQRTATTLVSSYLQHAEELRTLIDAVESGDGEGPSEPQTFRDKGKSRAESPGSDNPSNISQQADTGQGGSASGVGIVRQLASSPTAIHDDSTVSISNIPTIIADEDAGLTSPALSIPSRTNPLAELGASTSALSISPLAASPPSNWQKDQEASDCQQCGRKFSFLLRRHHCRPGAHFEVRVCDGCHAYLTGPASPLRSATAYAQAQAAATAAAAYARRSSFDSSRMEESNDDDDDREREREHVRSRGSVDERSLASRAESLMNECPVCGAPLDVATMGQEEIEKHVATCLGGGAGGEGLTSDDRMAFAFFSDGPFPE